MKNLTLLFMLLSVMFAANANDNLYLTDNFNYTDGTEIEGAGGWFRSSSSKQGSSFKTSSTPLVYGEYISSGVGGSLLANTIGLTSPDVADVIAATTFSSSSLEVGATVYTAFLVDGNSLSSSSSGREFFQHTNIGGTTTRGRLYYKTTTSGVSFGIGKSATAGNSAWSEEVSRVNTALIVVKYVNGSTSSTGNADNYFIFVNPDITKTEDENASVMIAAPDNNSNGGTNIQNITFRANTNTVDNVITATIGGLRVAKTWAEAVKAKQAQAIEIESTTPLNNDYVKAVSTTSAVITFDKVITAGTGHITLSTPGNDDVTISLTECSISNRTATIPFSLKEVCDYSLDIPAGAFMSGEATNSDISLKFSTKENNPDLFLQEYFNYKDATNIEDINGWLRLGTGAGSSFTTSESPLQYPNYVGSNIGGSLLANTIGAADVVDAVTFSSSTLAVDATVYSAFLVDGNSLSGSSSGREFFQHTSLTGNVTRGKVFYKTTSSGVSFGIAKAASASSAVWSNEVPRTSTALIVVKYVNGANSGTGNDNFYLFVNPNPAVSEIANGAVMVTAPDNNTATDTNIQNVSFRANTNTDGNIITATVGGLRVAKTWNAALDYSGATNNTKVETTQSNILVKEKLLQYVGNENATATIYSVSGQQLLKKTLEPKEIVSISNTTGVYVVRLQLSNGKIETSKVIIK